jgi:hypothetical protein
MQNEKNMIIIEKVHNNLTKILSFLDINIPPEEENFTIFIQNFLIFYFTNYKFKLENKNSKQANFHFASFINDSLKLMNSKFLISETISKLEFINIIVYFIINFEVVGDYIDYLSNLNKKYINVSIENIFNKDINIDVSIKSDQSNFLQSYNKFNMTCKNLKKQIDSFVNLSYKLNEFKKNQASPVK